MSDFKLSAGDYSGIGEVRIGIAAARWNDAIVDQLLRGCVETLGAHGIGEARLTVIRVPGAFELPLAAKRLAAGHDAVIALGAVIRGDTPHFDYVSSACTSGLAEVALSENKSVTMGVLTVDTMEQAVERAGNDSGNKGAEAAITCLEMLSVLRPLGA